MSKRDDAIYRAALVRQEAGEIAAGYEAGLVAAEAEVARLRALLRRWRRYQWRSVDWRQLFADTDEALKED